MSLNANSAAVTVRGLTRTFGDQVAGLLSADEGYIRLAGATVRPWKTNFEAHKKLGYLSEDPVFFPWMSGMELLELVGGLFNLTSAQARQKAKEALEIIGLTSRAEDRIGSYSRGMRQRIGIAQAS